MCDLAKERKHINQVLILALKSDAARECKDSRQLAGVMLEALRAHYADKCPDECIQKRCEEFAASVFE